MRSARRRPLASALGLLGVLAAACRDTSMPSLPDTTAPSPPPLIAVSVVAQGAPEVSLDSVGTPFILCSVTLRAIATGPRRVMWQDGLLRWFEGRDRSTPVDSTPLSADEIRSSWGKPDVSPGDTLLSLWQVYAYVPFAATIEYRYLPEGETTRRTVSASFTCGPTIPPDAPPPAITDLSVTPSSGEIEPGDTLSIAYTATSPVKLWQTKVVLSGACDSTLAFTEYLEPSVTRTLRLPIPPGCVLALPLRVSVLAIDAAVQTSERLLITSLALVDRTPPRIVPLFFPPGGGSGDTDIRGDLFGGDSIQVWFNASDNNALRALVWEVLPFGYRDSLLVTGAFASTVFIKTSPAWSGTIQLRLFARDAVGLTSNEVVTSPNALQIYPTIARATQSASVTGEIRDVAIDTRRGMLYLLQSNQARIAFLSTSIMTVTRTIAMPSYPTGFDLSAGGDSLLVALPNQRALGILDLRQVSPAPVLLPLTNLDTTIGQMPVSVLALANGKAFVFTSGNGTAAARLIEVDLTTGTERVRTDAWEGGRVPTEFEQVFPRLARSPDHSAVALSSEPWQHQRYDVVTDAFGPIQTTNAGGGVSLSTAGQRVAVGFDVFDASLNLLSRVRTTILPGGVIPTALSPDGETLYQAVPYSGVVRSRVSDGAILDRTLNPVIAGQARLSADGTLFITVESNYGATSRISTIDLR